MPPSSSVLALALAAVAARQADPLAGRSRGRSDAPITVYEMADFQCPACRQFATTTLPTIERDWIATGKVRWVFVNFPLTQIHKNAVAAAQVAMCAARQGKFWEMHDALYRNQDRWAPLDEPGPALVALADSAGVAHAPLVSCIESKATLDEIGRDAQGAVRSGAGSTPTFYIEGGLLEGAWPAADFSHILDSIYLAKGGTH